MKHTFRHQRLVSPSSYKKWAFAKRIHDTRKVWGWTLIVAVGIPVVAASSWFYVSIVRTLPDIKEIENFDFKEATVITDKNGEVLYKLFEENRDYVSYENIAPQFVNALIATEDQRFWTNPGIDVIGTLRAWITDVLYGKTQGGSTITQQLIKNIMLTPEKKIERKLKEIILAMKLNNYIKWSIQDKYDQLSTKELDKKVKEKVLELYANYIFLGNNTYGVETAARSYFDVSAKDLDILQAAILAGLPQAPSRYDPYTNKAALMGEVVITDGQEVSVEISTWLQQAVLEKITASINSPQVSFKKDAQSSVDYIVWLLSAKLTYEGQVYQIAYRPGRKDSVLARMYEEGYITESEYKQAFLEGIDYKFQRGNVAIKAPHFVFWVINQLEQNYDPELLRKWGLTVKTTLDYNIQKMAEESIGESAETLKTYQANNTALLYADSQNGDIIAYVGSKDYYDETIDGQVDNIQSKRQPGSTIKPLLYALWFMKLAITLDSPIYDTKISIAGNTPNNVDGTFNGLMAIKNALAGSRNIPAIKMFFAIGGETIFKEYLQSLGVTSLDMTQEIYGYPLAIGSAEIPMLDLVTAYTHLSAGGKPAKINPILEITTSDGSILYKKEIALAQQVIPSGVSYLLWDILSNNANMPPGWSAMFTIPGISFATKSGTTNVVGKNKEKLPRDGWLITYTPSKVMAFWAGNTDGTALRKDAYGGWINSPARKSFVKKLQAAQLITNEKLQEAEVKSVSISKVSGKLANFDTPLALTKKSLGYIKTLPTEVDDTTKKIQIDRMCGGIPGPLTPSIDLQDAYFITPSSFMPDQRDLPQIVEWRKETGITKLWEELGTFVTIEALTGSCAERDVIAELGEISINIIHPKPGDEVTRNFTIWHQTKSPFKVKSIKIYLGEVELKTFNYNKSGDLIDINTITIPEAIAPGSYELKVIVIDEKGFSDTKSVQVTLVATDTKPPYLLEDKIKITAKANNAGYDVVLLFNDDASLVTTWTIEKDGKVVQTFNGNIAIFSLPTLGKVSYSVIDKSGNKAGGTVTLTAPN